MWWEVEGGRGKGDILLPNSLNDWEIGRGNIIIK
jgi:hypothetical protein